MLKALQHKNIVKIMNLFSLKDNQIVIVMEFLEGGELCEYVREKGNLEEGDAKHFFKQIAEAVNYCHRENLIHKDLKLENVLLVDKESKICKVRY